MFAFVFTLLVYVACILGGLVVLAIPYLIIKRGKRALFALMGVLCLVAAFPVGFFADVTTGGCCGDANNQQGWGGLLGIALAGLGIYLLYKAITYKSRSTVPKNKQTP